MFNHDFTGVNESGDFSPIPEGTYTFRIGKKEIKKSKGGHNYVKVELTVTEGEYAGKKVFHNVFFLPADNAGAGISKRWLHSIGEEYMGNVQVSPSQWEGLVTCDIIIEPYTKEDGTPGKSNKVKQVHLPDAKTAIVNKRDKNVDASDVPF